MTEQCKHKWEIDGRDIFIDKCSEYGIETMTVKEATYRINEYETARYQIERAIAQLSEPYIKTPVDATEVKLTVMSVVAQLTMYIEGE